MARLLACASLAAAALSHQADSRDACTSWYDAPGMAHGPGFRNVKSYGAVGDGVTDDSAAIISALTEGRSARPFSVSDPTLVYIPPGTYLISKTLPLYFYTYLVGNFRCMPTLLVASGAFPHGGYVVDSDIDDNGEHDDEFYRGLMHVRIQNQGNNSKATMLHWAQSQATTIRDVVIEAGDAKEGSELRCKHGQHARQLSCST